MNNINARLVGESEYNYIKRVYELRKKKLNEAVHSLKKNNTNSAKQEKINKLKEKVNELEEKYKSLMNLDGGRRKTRRSRLAHKKRTLRRCY
jgi:galactokinase